MRSRRSIIAAAVLGAASVGWALAPATSSADTGAPYDASAQANAIDFSTTNQALPLSLVLEGGGPEADVHKTSLGQGDADASLPYIGNALPSAPGLVASIVGLPLPDYPLTATSYQGGKDGDVSYPGIALHTESADATTLARGVGGTTAQGATSQARVDVAADGSVVAKATTDANALTLGGYLTVAGVHASATIQSDSSGAVTKSSSFSLSEISAPGLSLSVPATVNACPVNQLPVGGVPAVPCPSAVKSIPMPAPIAGKTINGPDVGFEDGSFVLTVPVAGVPVTFPLPAQPVFDAFKAAGVSLSYQAPVSTSSSIAGANLQVGFTLPAAGATLGPTPVTFTVGSTLASLVTQPIVPAPSTSGSVSGAAPTSPTATGGAGAGSASSTGSDGASSDLTDAGGAVGGVPTVPDLTTPGLGGDGLAPSIASTGSPPPTAPSLAAARSPVAVNAQDIYLAFVVVAAAAFAAMTVLRLMGVRLLWGS